LGFLNGGFLNLNLGNEFGVFSLEAGAHLLVSFSFSWVLRLLGINT
jgi:hypothetical protein